MRTLNRAWLVIPILLILLLLGVVAPAYSDLVGLTGDKSQEDIQVTLTLVGQVVSTQDAPIEDARAQLLVNATYIGSAPNVVAAGYLDRAGSRVTFRSWLKVGVPVLIVTILVPTVWIIVRYFWPKF